MSKALLKFLLRVFVNSRLIFNQACADVCLLPKQKTQVLSGFNKKRFPIMLKYDQSIPLPDQGRGQGEGSFLIAKVS